MPHFPEPFYRAPQKRWYVQLDGGQIPRDCDLDPARDRKTKKPIPPKAVIDRDRELMAAKDESRQAPVIADRIRPSGGHAIPTDRFMSPVPVPSAQVLPGGPSIRWPAHHVTGRVDDGRLPPDDRGLRPDRLAPG